MSKFFQAKAYLSYWLNCVDEHSLHSPFFYDFYTKVVKKNSIYNEEAERLRAQLLKSELTVDINDLGAGSVLKSKQRHVKDIAKHSLSNAKFSSLYSRVIQFYQCNQVIELGTCLGINTLYLASAKPTSLTTFEGADTLIGLAKDTFSFANVLNIKLIEGNIDETLESYLRANPKIDFAFVDANHRYDAVMRYFRFIMKASHNKTIIVFDDIHLNPGMEQAWSEIKKDSLVYATADLFRCGFVFLDPSLNRNHKVLRF
ncbi:class I SAM-dependent methyltransferase [Chryseotalea sanaruensis]|uniref:Class I SAM-dependent methyltransferase n=1 Tax=Chryseotalea sanaruensis TaxID=2482724 RepID=A0A401UET3_9BACT|nr:class I SAM-dependent methyltransferase [Chryseotalea sanaruensis]GCC53377.1 class I SAM-dependent methyltransferase [Chryseotalea sanaruensis]